MNRRAILLLTAGHCTVDLCQAVVVALLPFFREHFDLDYVGMAFFVCASSITSSVVQPLFGQMADRVSAPWLLPASVFFTGAGLVAAATTPYLALSLAAVAVSGLGVAAFHPEAARLINFASGHRRTTGMSIFSIGGNAGFALGPLLTAGLLAQFGQSGTLAFLWLAGVVALFLFLDQAGFTELIRNHHKSRPTEWHAHGEQWAAFALLGVLIAFRSSVFAGLNTFLAVYWIDHLHQSEEMGRLALALFLGSGVAGTLIGGWLGDRIGRRELLCRSLVVFTGLVWGFGYIDDPRMCMLMLVPIGMSLYASASVLVVLGQEYLPGRIGVASGVTIGLAVSFGGGAAPLLGWVANAYGIAILPRVLAGIAVVATVLGYALPPRRTA